MFIMLHSSSITLYYHSFNLCSILGFLLFFKFLNSFYSIILMLFAQIQQIEHFVAFEKLLVLLKSNFIERSFLFFSFVHFSFLFSYAYQRKEKRTGAKCRRQGKRYRFTCRGTFYARSKKRTKKKRKQGLMNKFNLFF